MINPFKNIGEATLSLLLTALLNRRLGAHRESAREHGATVACAELFMQRV